MNEPSDNGTQNSPEPFRGGDVATRFNKLVELLKTQIINRRLLIVNDYLHNLSPAEILAAMKAEGVARLQIEEKMANWGFIPPFTP